MVKISEWTYSGWCPECGKHSTFWGGGAKCWCEECDTEANPADLNCIGMCWGKDENNKKQKWEDSHT